MLSIKLKKLFLIFLSTTAFLTPIKSSTKALSICPDSIDKINDTTDRTYNPREQLWAKYTMLGGITKYIGFFRGFSIEFLVNENFSVTVSSLNPYLEDMFNKIIKFMTDHEGTSPTCIMDCYGIEIRDKIYITRNLTRILGIIE